MIYVTASANKKATYRKIYGLNAIIDTIKST